MANFDFEAPSFSLGLDFDQTQADDFETLIVDDSEPDYPDTHPKPNRLIRTGNRNQNVATSCKTPETTKLHVGIRRRFQVIDSDSDTDDGPSVSDTKCNISETYLNANQGQFEFDLTENLQNNRSSGHVTIDLDETLPPAHRYFFHYDLRIQELVRSRLCNFSPLDDELNIGVEQCSQSKIDYTRQFSCGETSIQDAGNISGKKSSTRRKFTRKSKNEELSSPGWVNPKFGVDKVKTKGAAKRKVIGEHQSPGQWLTGSDGKKENGAGFKKSKRRFFSKKKK